MPALSTTDAFDLVVDTCRRYGERSIIALAGVPGTGKSYIAEKAAKEVAGDPLRVRTCQFHPSYTYEEFVEGLRTDPSGAVHQPGMLLEWSDQAMLDPSNKYVLLIDELTRADITSVLGELFTYIEYRDRPFLPLYSRMPRKIAPNLVVLATYNPLDKNALMMDAALVRRLRILEFTPSMTQLREMLTGTLPGGVITALQTIFEQCERQFDNFGQLMPFGHGIFADVEAESPDLYDLWHERIVHLVRPPAASPHPFVDVIEANYPWRRNKAHSTAGGSPPDVPTGIDTGQASSGTSTEGEFRRAADSVGPYDVDDGSTSPVATSGHDEQAAEDAGHPGPSDEATGSE